CWSSSGHDKAIHDSEFAGRLDFNQYTEGESHLRVLLEVQSPLKQRDKRVSYPGALNSKAGKVEFFHQLFSRSLWRL
ncbi:MAG TPA: hypothetical protein PKX36_05330, partial [Candidatus Cloacimonadota bacterium]|nr:hypothetical protein [Candidatus Cloacimonadota bacterium]